MELFFGIACLLLALAAIGLAAFLAALLQREAREGRAALLSRNATELRDALQPTPPPAPTSEREDVGRIPGELDDVLHETFGIGPDPRRMRVHESLRY